MKKFTFENNVIIEVEYKTGLKTNSFCDGQNIEVDSENELVITIKKDNNVIFTGNKITELSKNNAMRAKGVTHVLEYTFKKTYLTAYKAKLVIDYLDSFKSEKTENTESNKTDLCPKCGTYCFGDCTAN